MSGAEIIGLAGSVIQVADIGLRLSVKIYTFTRKVKSADKDIDKLSDEIATTGAVLQQLGTALSDKKAGQLCSPQAIATAQKLIDDCKAVFDRLEKTIDGRDPTKKGKISLKLRLGFTFLESEIAELKANLERLKSSLHVILNVLILAAQLRNQEALPILQDQQTLLKTLVAENAVKEKQYLEITRLIQDKVASSPITSFARIRTPPPKSPASPALDPTLLPRGLRHHYGTILDHGKLVETLLKEIGSSNYKIDYAHRAGLHHGILDIHWKTWSGMRRDYGYQVFMKLFKKFEDVARHWNERTVSRSPSRSRTPPIRREETWGSTRPPSYNQISAMESGSDTDMPNLVRKGSRNNKQVFGKDSESDIPISSIPSAVNDSETLSSPQPVRLARRAAGPPVKHEYLDTDYMIVEKRHVQTNAFSELPDEKGSLVTVRGPRPPIPRKLDKNLVSELIPVTRGNTGNGKRDLEIGSTSEKTPEDEQNAAPTKRKRMQKMSLTTFLDDQTLGSWADEVDDFGERLDDRASSTTLAAGSSMTGPSQTTSSQEKARLDAIFADTLSKGQHVGSSRHNVPVAAASLGMPSYAAYFDRAKLGTPGKRIDVGSAKQVRPTSTNLDVTPSSVRSSTSRDDHSLRLAVSGKDPTDHSDMVRGPVRSKTAGPDELVSDFGYLTIRGARNESQTSTPSPSTRLDSKPTQRSPPLHQSEDQSLLSATYIPGGDSFGPGVGIPSDTPKFDDTPVVRGAIRGSQHRNEEASDVQFQQAVRAIASLGANNEKTLYFARQAADEDKSNEATTDLSSDVSRLRLRNRNPPLIPSSAAGKESATTLMGTTACDTCERRNIRCSGGEPCKNCTQATLQCTYGASSQEKDSNLYQAGALTGRRRSRRQNVPPPFNPRDPDASSNPPTAARSTAPIQQDDRASEIWSGMRGSRAPLLADHPIKQTHTAGETRSATQRNRSRSREQIRKKISPPVRASTIAGLYTRERPTASSGGDERGKRFNVAGISTGDEHTTIRAGKPVQHDRRSRSRSRGRRSPASRSGLSSGAGMTSPMVVEKAFKIIADELNTDVSELTDDGMWSWLGVDSAKAATITERFRREHLGVEVGVKFFERQPRVGVLRRYLVDSITDADISRPSTPSSVGTLQEVLKDSPAVRKSSSPGARYDESYTTLTERHDRESRDEGYTAGDHPSDNELSDHKGRSSADGLGYRSSKNDDPFANAGKNKYMSGPSHGEETSLARVYRQTAGLTEREKRDLESERMRELFERKLYEQARERQELYERELEENKRSRTLKNVTDLQETRKSAPKDALDAGKDVTNAGQRKRIYTQAHEGEPSITRDPKGTRYLLALEAIQVAPRNTATEQREKTQKQRRERMHDREDEHLRTLRAGEIGLNEVLRTRPQRKDNPREHPERGRGNRTQHWSSSSSELDLDLGDDHQLEARTSLERRPLDVDDNDEETHEMVEPTDEADITDEKAPTISNKSQPAIASGSNADWISQLFGEDDTGSHGDGETLQSTTTTPEDAATEQRKQEKKQRRQRMYESERERQRKLKNGEISPEEARRTAPRRRDNRREQLERRRQLEEESARENREKDLEAKTPAAEAEAEADMVDFPLTDFTKDVHQLLLDFSTLTAEEINNAEALKVDEDVPLVTI